MNILASLSLAFLLLFVQVPQQARPDVASSSKIAKTSTTLNDDKQLLEIGSGLRLRALDLRPKEIKFLSYNIRWRGGEDLKKLIRLFREDPEIGNASVLALQEVDRDKKRTQNTNTVRQLANELGLHYAWAAPPTEPNSEEEETGVAILSAYPLSDIRRIVLPNEGPNHRRRVALGATMNIGVLIRVYSVHSETRISVDKKLEQMRAVIRDLDNYPNSTRAIVLGDLNTWEASAGSKTRKLFTEASFTTPFGGQTTFSRRVLFVPIDLHLDWVWLRGLEAVSHGVDRKITISDHFPLWVTIRPPTEH